MIHACDLLVVGTSVDAHVSAVLGHVSRSLRTCRFDVDLYPKSSSIRVLPEADNNSVIYTDSAGISFDLSTARAVWFRRTGQPGLVTQIVEPAHRKFAIDESEAVINALPEFLAGAEWVSPYYATRRASSKLYQLTAASACGLRIPKTLVANDVDQVRTFLDQHPQALYKTLAKPSLQYRNRRTIIFSHKLSSTDTDLLEDIRLAPCLFQEYVEKAFELRITAIGEIFHCVRIYSQNCDEGRIDWRAALIKDLKYENVDLTSDLATRLRSLMRSLSLRFGAIDMIVTPQGENVFLEINPHGAWLWLETMLGFPASATLAQYLSQLAAPVVHSSAPPTPCHARSPA